MIKAVIFDLDDTLISEKDYIKSGYSHVSEIIAGKYNLEFFYIYDSLLNLFSESHLEVFNRFLEKEEIDFSESDIKLLVSEYRHHRPNISFFEDALSCIQQLKLLELKVGIITDGYAYSQRMKLNAIDASCLFDDLVVTDELGREYWKPHPKSFELMSDRLNVKYSEMMYVGDNPKKDFYIKDKLCGLYTVKINRNGLYQNCDLLNNVPPDYTIQNLHELVELVCEINGIENSELGEK